MDRAFKPSVTEFLNNYAFKSRPVILEGITDDWAASTKWTWEYVQDQFGSNIQFAKKCRNKAEPGKSFTITEYIEYMRNNNDADPFYLKNCQFHRNTELINDYPLPEYLQSWHVALPEDSRPFLSWLYLASKDTFSSIHLDIFNTSAWNAVISGKKLWLFYHPDDYDFLYDGIANPFEPDLNKFPYLSKTNPIWGIQSPGEVIYTPSNWWHAVYNLEAGISLTENFVNQSNYNAVLKNLYDNGLNEQAMAFELIIKMSLA